MSFRPVISATAFAMGALLAFPASASAQTPLEDPIPQPIAIGAVRIGLEPVATGLTAYDATYLWLAKHLDAELVTLDGELGNASPA